MALSKSLTGWLMRIDKASKPTNADMLMVGNYIKTQCLVRTEQGVDADGRAFAPYSTKGPYYWNPYTGDGSAITNQKRAVTRMMKKLGASGRKGSIKDGAGNKLGERSRFGTSIKFASYAAFKQSLGRTGVDLTGPRAPHMLQALQVRVAPGGKGVVLGVYGEAAARAHGHQHGNPARGLPQRKFLGATPDDRKYCLRLLSAQIRGRWKKTSNAR